MTTPTLSDKTYIHHILAVAPCSFESIKNWLEFQFDAGDKAQAVIDDLAQRGLIKLEDGAYWL